MKYALIASLLFVGSAFADQIAPCSAGTAACTSEYKPAVCQIFDMRTGRFVRMVQGSNACMAEESFRSRQCDAHLRNPFRFADASSFTSECRDL